MHARIDAFAHDRGYCAILRTLPLTWKETLMRKLLIVALMLAPTAAWAAGGAELTPQVGYMWGGTQEFIGSGLYPLGGDLHANANVTYGGTLGFAIRPGYDFELSYHYQSTDLLIRPNGQKSFKGDDLTTQYFLLQGARNLPAKGKAAPFVLGGVGMVSYNAYNTSKNFLAFDFGGGVKMAINPKVGLRLQVRGLLPVQWFSTGVYFGTGGSGVSVSGSSSLIQGDASLGLTFKLGS
jgi:opacity protein-like surface antigen